MPRLASRHLYRYPLALVLVASAALITVPTTAHAQRLRERISQLFIFGSGQDPLFLAGSATASNPAAIRAHGDHFVPSESAENGSIIGFIGSALAASVGNIPIGATTSGQTFRFVGGVPVSTGASAGPIFAERGQTLGRGRLLAGLNRSSFTFSTLRGRPLNDIDLVFTHENVNFNGCDQENGGQSCAKLGVPVLENETMDFNLNINLAVDVSTFYTTFGITDHIDFGVAVPTIEARFSGTSTAQINPWGGGQAAHYFSGTPSDPVLSAMKTSSGSAFGIGDVAARLKVNAYGSPTTSLALLADARFPTGSSEDLLGAGYFSLRSMAILSARAGDFSPHANVGVLYRAGIGRNNTMLATLGFDHLLGSRVTLAADVVSEFQIGDSRLILPKPVNFEAPFRRTIRPTTIPDIRDDIINGSFGFKFATARHLLLVTNALIPLNRGGLRADRVWTTGLEYTF